MKKFLYFFGILALIAGLVSSCSKDEDEGGNGNTAVPQKKLVKVSAEKWWTEFKYDNNGRCISSTYKFYDEDNNVDGDYYLYTYEENKITCEEYDLDGSHFGTDTYILNSEGHITSWELKIDNHPHLIKTEYRYNDNNQLIYTQFSEGDQYEQETTYEWEDGNIIKEIKGESETIYIYTNDKYPTPIENKTNIMINEFDEPIFSKTGVACKNLPVAKKTRNSEDQYEWTLDKDRYLIKHTEIKYDGDKYTKELFWE